MEGKSYLGCYWVFSQCMAFAGTKYLIGRKELINLRKTTLATFFKMVGELGFVPSDLFSLNSMTNTIKFRNGSEIVLMDMAYKPSDPEYLRFGGLELTGAFIDESNESEEKALGILKTRIGRAKNKEFGLLPKLLETFNPSKNHVYFRYYKPFKNKAQLDHIVFIPALVTDNPYLDDVYINQLRKADKITRERLLNGNFEYDDDPSRLFDFDALNDLFTNKPVLNEQCEKFLTVDVARFGTDLSVLMLWKGFYVYKVKYFKKNTLKELREYIEELCVKEGVRRSHVVVDEDGVGSGLVDELVGCKGFVNNSRPIVTEQDKVKGREINFVNLKTQCYYACAEAVNNGKVGVYSSFPEFARNRLIEDLEQVKRKNPDRDEKIRLVGKDEIKDVIGRSPDFGDCCMMRWFFELKPRFVCALA